MTAQDASLELFLDGAWTSVPLFDTPAAVERGTAPYSDSWPEASQFSCEIDNSDLNYDPANPEAAIYGVAGRNTTARLELNATTGLTAEVAEWSPERTPAHYLGGGRGRSSTDVTAEGVLGRVGRWTDQLRSPMYTTNGGRSTSIGHWPLEDGRLAALLSNTLPGGQAATVAGEYTLADTDAPLGAATSVRLTDTTVLNGRFAAASTTAGWQVFSSFKLDQMPSDATHRGLLYWRTSNGYLWQMQVNNAGYRLVVLDEDNALATFADSTFGGQLPTDWTTLRVKASQSGGTITAEIAWYVQGAAASVGYTDAFSGTIGAPATWGWFGNEAISVTDGGRVSHVGAVTGGTDDLDGTDARLVFDGYLSELTTTRFLRLCAQKNITAYLTGDEADGTPMGPQRPDTFVNLHAEIHRTEDGRIDDVRTEVAMVMRTRRDMYAQDPALELTFPGDISPPFRRIIDAAATANHVTASNADGGEVVTSLDSGPMSTQATPDGVGEYRKTVEVSVADEASDLPNIANWHLAKGTIEKPRYSTLVVNLVANPHLAAACAAVGLGDLITVDGFEPDLLRLLVTKVRARVGRGVWRYEFDTELYEPWNAGRWDAFRWDARTSTVDGAHSLSTTSIALTTPDINDVWSTSMTGVDLDIEGERVTVVTMGAASGSGPYTQTATVRRSANGVRKAQKDGARVHLADAKRWGL